MILPTLLNYFSFYPPTQNRVMPYLLYTCIYKMKIIKSIGVLLLFSLVLAQDPSVPTTQPVQNAAQAAPTAESDTNIAQNIPQEDQPKITQEDQPKVTKEEGAPTPQQDGSLSSQPEQTIPQEGQPSKNPLDLDEEQTKSRIKKLLSEMSPDELKHFESQLAGDARKYYDDIMAETLKHENEQNEQYQEAEQELLQEETPYQKQNAKENSIFNAEWEKYSDRDINYNEYLFTVDDSTTEDFRISMPVGQLVTFYGFVYHNSDGVYSVPSEVEGKDPTWIYVYENNHKIVYQQEFYFKYFGSFHGSDNTSYLIRFVNPSDHKMVAFNLAVLFEIGHSAEKLTAVDVADHGRRIKVSQEQLTTRLKDSYSRNVFEAENREKLLDKMERYYIYSIVEILIIAVLCVMQVQFVRKLLTTSSVV